MITPVILCGGSGTRLWPASRDSFPKQFISMMGGWSTYQNTLLRVNDPAQFAKPIVVTNRKFADLTAEQARAVGCDVEIMAEPCRRDSAPAVAAATEHVFRSNPTAALLVLAADHAIPDMAAFRADCAQALPAVDDGAIVTFGIQPTHPATSYGYLDPGAGLQGSKVRALNAFVEKPDAVTAQTYMDAGYLWNSGNFLFRADTMRRELENHAPAILEAVSAALDTGSRDGNVTALQTAAFESAPSISIDYAVMEKTQHSAVLPASFTWSDVGSWDAIWELGEKDSSGNVTSGETHLTDCSNVLVDSGEGILTAAIGLEEAFVIATPDAVLVGKLAQSQRVKDVVSELDGARHPQRTRFTLANSDGDGGP